MIMEDPLRTGICDPWETHITMKGEKWIKGTVCKNMPLVFLLRNSAYYEIGLIENEDITWQLAGLIDSLKDRSCRQGIMTPCAQGLSLCVP